jgi:hypothetical protein
MDIVVGKQIEIEKDFISTWTDKHIPAGFYIPCVYYQYINLWLLFDGTFEEYILRLLRGNGLISMWPFTDRAHLHYAREREIMEHMRHSTPENPKFG